MITCERVLSCFLQTSSKSTSVPPSNLTTTALTRRFCPVSFRHHQSPSQSLPLTSPPQLWPGGSVLSPSDIIKVNTNGIWPHHHNFCVVAMISQTSIVFLALYPYCIFHKRLSDVSSDIIKVQLSSTLKLHHHSPGQEVLSCFFQTLLEEIEFFVIHLVNVIHQEICVKYSQHLEWVKWYSNIQLPNSHLNLYCFNSSFKLQCVPVKTLHCHLI